VSTREPQSGLPAGLSTPRTFVVMRLREGA
jgi:hypothetical protein